MLVMAAAERRTRDGGYIVPVDSLRVGDRLGLKAVGGGRHTWWPIVALDEKPKTRRVYIDLGAFSPRTEVGLLRRTTMVARAPREEER